MQTKAILVRTLAILGFLGGFLTATAGAARADDVPPELKPNVDLNLKGCIDLLAAAPSTFSSKGFWRDRSTTITFDKTEKKLHLVSNWTTDYFGTNLDTTVDFSNLELRLDKSSLGNFVMHCDRADTVDHCAYNLKDYLLDAVSDAEATVAATDTHGKAVIDCSKRLAAQFLLEARTRLARPFGDSRVSDDAPVKGQTSGLETEPKRRKTFVMPVR